jgi:hypothetical protein
MRHETIKRISRNQYKGFGNTFISECEVTMHGSYVRYESLGHCAGRWEYWATVPFKRASIIVCEDIAAPRGNDWAGERKYRFRAGLVLGEYCDGGRRGEYELKGKRATVFVAGREFTVTADVIRSWFGAAAPKRGVFEFRFHRK